VKKVAGKKKNPFSKEDTQWLRTKAVSLGGQLLVADDESVEVHFSDEKSAAEFKELVDTAHAEGQITVTAVEEQQRFNDDTDEYVDTVVRVYGDKPPFKVPGEEFNPSWSTILLIAAALAAFFLYKKTHPN
jgi:hypothetical protein